ncbi:RNA exonuclease 4 [Trichonephila inaurata madagascariensis]|uniref:RNA exonuclease 4 n=1 Tax=Trichonephila inaurata madagascariensis TaxID=2747483 RepID=A0A8X6WR18_9ARAC|nr:RNA exonuclease 4 [Trichonephila inaurata madagascariensis]
MVGVGPRGCDSILARVSIVNAYGECIYDTFVKPKEKVTDYRTFVLFIDHPRHLIRDTSKYAPFKKLSGNRTPSLKSLAAKLLGCEIQGAEHNSVS